MLELSWFLLALAVLSSALAILAHWNYRSIPALPILTGEAQLPSLSIIVPARNEARNLRRLLPSLNRINYPGEVEIIVVDDGSSDGSAQIAESFGTTVLRLDRLPAGWLGKPYACHRGVRSASGDWLLFTDADTAHSPHGPAGAVSYAIENGLDGLSLVVKINNAHILARSALTAAFAGLFTAQRSASELINGQYILMKRAAYQESGGFSAVCGEPLEDLALGRALEKDQRRLPILRGERAAQVWMYQDYEGLWNGLARIGAGSLKWLGASAGFSVLLITTAITPLWGIPGVAGGFLDIQWALLLWLLGTAGYIPWARHFGSGWQALLIPFGSIIVLVASIWGLMRALGGRGFVWKGRAVKSNPPVDEG